MAFKHAIERRMSELRQRGANIPEILESSQHLATKEAVATATRLTPPNETSGPYGNGTITGQSKAHWSTDSNTIPEIKISDGKTELTTTLANNLYHMSFLNDGHRMDQHFVPGLVINPYSGLLERVDPEIGGIVVGTKTTYVRGLYMREAALATYRRVLENELIKKTKELSK